MYDRSDAVGLTRPTVARVVFLLFFAPLLGFAGRGAMKSMASCCIVLGGFFGAVLGTERVFGMMFGFPAKRRLWLSAILAVHRDKLLPMPRQSEEIDTE